MWSACCQVRFYDPVGTQPEMIPVTKEMKAYVRSAHAKYQAKFEQVTIEEAEKREQARQKSDEEDRLRKEKEQMVAGFARALKSLKSA